MRKFVVLISLIFIICAFIFPQEQGTRANILGRNGNHWILDKGSTDGVIVGIKGYFWYKQKSGEKFYPMNIGRFSVVKIEEKKCEVVVEAIGEGFSEKNFQWASFLLELISLQRLGEKPRVEKSKDQAKKVAASEEIPSGKSVSWYMKTGDGLSEKGNFIEALKYYRQVQKLDTEDPVVALKIKGCEQKIKDQAEEEVQHRQFAGNEKKFNEYMERADDEISRNQAAFALKYVQSAHKLMPQREEEIGKRIKSVVEKDKAAWDKFVNDNGAEWAILFYKLFPLKEEVGPFGIIMIQIPGRNYSIGKYEVTQGQWQAVMGKNPSSVKKGDDYPVENVSWNDCQVFIQKLNQQTGKNYRLPAEAEWEYACRAGTTGDTYGDLGAIAWYSDNSGGSTHPVGQKQPNAFGLYDMLGNVWEWCQDLYDTSGSDRVSRGGCWDYGTRYARASFRLRFEPGGRYYILGFRLAMDRIPEVIPDKPEKNDDDTVIRLTSNQRPKLIHQIDPLWSAAALNAHAHGVVVLDVTIDVYGHVQGVNVVSGHPLLNDAALAAIKQWIYEPYMVDGRTKSARFTVTMTFFSK